ncbi:MAG: CRTAC1 family protein [Verrucomicrobia bacterium]|nr:CRTAC1 family protein [Verrucomicrobiota bacterium]MDA1006552.1 CRTAC1 family protein [Verrucomicrobiota bacterium]
MRSDETLPQSFRDESQWIIDPSTGEKKPEFERLNLYGTEFHKHPYSGYERNKLFINQGGTDFLDISSVSGADDIADSRTWVRWDFDKDGRTDIAVVNANRPLLSWYRNQSKEASHRAGNGFIALRIQGANDKAEPAKGVATRDGYGVRVVIEAGDLRMEREHLCGEGYAGQNSATMLVGIGDAAQATVTVHWPGGEASSPILLNAGDLVHCNQQRGETSFRLSRYGGQGVSTSSL